MPDHAFLTDDAVAERLINEATDYSLRFSALGVDSGRPRPENKPKPNTRFLRNIIRTTKNHNAALLAKEVAESQARLQELQDAEERQRRRRRPEPHEVRRRQMRDISAILHGGRKGRSAAAEPSTSSISHRGQGCTGVGPTDPRPIDARDRGTSSKGSSLVAKASSNSKPKNGDHRLKDGKSDGDSHRVRGERRPRLDHDDERSGRGSSRRRGRDLSRHRRRSFSPDGTEMQRRRSRRERSALRDEDSSDKDSHNSTPRRGRRRRDLSGSRHLTDHCERRQDGGEMEGSDPLEDAIGPLPPPPRPTRGRGNTARMSGIDARFSDSYDPSSDLTYQDQPAGTGSSGKGEDGGGWDNTVEAFRDRQTWKAQGAARLRAAGFTESQVQKWERGDGAGPGGGGDVSLDEFRWSKKGELRQWDQGKTVNADGSVSTGPEWAK